MQTISDELFNELREAAVGIWMTYDNTYGYVDEKVGYIDKLKNVRDNYGTIIGMFDINNQYKLYKAVGDEGKAVIDDWVGGLKARVAEAKSMGLF